MNNAIHEPMAMQTPINVTKNMSCCGCREILYNPLVLGWSEGAFLKLNSAMTNPVKPNMYKTIPTTNITEPIFNGVKIIRTK